MRSHIASWHLISALIRKTEASRALQVFFASATPETENSLAAFPTKLLENMQRKCYDPRDKFYGVLHLSRGFARMIQPDYGKSLAPILLEYVAASTTLYRWPLGPSFSYMLVNSIKTMGLEFAQESPGLVPRLQAIIDKDTFDDHVAWFPSNGISSRDSSHLLQRIRLYFPVYTSRVLHGTEAGPGYVYREEPGAKFPSNRWQLPVKISNDSDRATRLWKFEHIRFQLSPSQPQSFQHDQYFTAFDSRTMTPVDVRDGDIVVSFNTSDGLALIARDAGIITGEAEARLHLRAIAISGPYAAQSSSQMQRRQAAIERHSRWLCSFSVTAAELFTLSLAAGDHSQLIRMLAHGRVGNGKLEVIDRKRGYPAVEPSLQQSAIIHEEAAWRSWLVRQPKRTLAERPRVIPLETGPCRQMAFDCCGFVDPAWMTLDGKIEGGSRHEPVCPWILGIRAQSHNIEDEPPDESSTLAGGDLPSGLSPT